ncbi:MAG: hypothetical protein RMK99_16905, partial [Anaerolineales bacterium]|nr:hypothetical protein [Anaerolineales bacterium]
MTEEEMMGRAAIRLLLTVLCAVVGFVLWPWHASGAERLIDRLPHLRLQLAVTPFLYPPYYGSEQVNCVFDHEYPIYFTGEKDFGEPISSTVVHNDGIRRPIGGIGTPGCYSGHDGIDYGLVYERVLAAADGTVGDARWAFPQNHRADLGMFMPRMGPISLMPYLKATRPARSAMPLDAPVRRAFEPAMFIG